MPIGAAPFFEVPGKSNPQSLRKSDLCTGQVMSVRAV